MFWDSHDASGDDVWESERTARSLHSRTAPQDQEAEIHRLVKGAGQKGCLKVPIAQH